MSKNRAAVLLATYNGSKYVQEFMDSLVQQTYTNLTLIVRDDGSSDNTIQLIREYSQKLEIQFLDCDARLGPALSFYELLVRAGGEFAYYFFADQDDCWRASKIERAIEMLSAEKSNVAMYCSRLEYVDQNLVHINYSRVPRVISLENALVENIATGCTLALTAPARNLVVSARPSQIVMHDWWFYIVCAAFGKVFYDSFPSIQYRQHGNNAIGAATNILQDFYRRIRRYARKNGGIFGLAAQTEAFKHCYASSLSHEQLELVNGIIEGKSKLYSRIRLAFFSKFIRQRWTDTVILRVLFMLGKY